MAHAKIRFPTRALWLLQESGGEGDQCILFMSAICTFGSPVHGVALLVSLELYGPPFSHPGACLVPVLVDKDTRGESEAVPPPI